MKMVDKIASDLCLDQDYIASVVKRSQDRDFTIEIITLTNETVEKEKYHNLVPS